MGKRFMLQIWSCEYKNYQLYDNRRRLSNLAVNSGNTAIMDNDYTFDAVSNVLSVANNASLPASGNAGGKMSHAYTYDGLYRLASATGTYTGADSKSASYTLAMGYDNMHRITSKSQHLTQDNVQFSGTLNVGYDLTYTYGTEDGKKFQLASVKDVNYRTEETPGDNNIENNHVYLYDKNGNLIYVNTGRLMNDGHNETGTGERKLIWDEENRLLAVDDNGFVSNYWYDADGERTVKTSGESDQVYVNGVFSGGSTNTAKFSLYVSPYLVANQGGRYTKHIYAGSQRIVSKIGDFASYGSDPRRIEYAGANTDGLSVDYKAKYAAQQQVIKDNYKFFDVPYNGTDNDNYADGEGFCCNDGSMEAAMAQARKAQARAVARSFKDPDNYENLQFFYHPDHLGSSSFITNLEGEVVQHIEYVPFGEVFIEERNNVWNTPYLFNAKEFDEETGMYYYGARYYEPRLSLWMSVDPLTEKNNDISGYIYCHNRPTILIDPTGMDDDVPETSKGNTLWYPGNTAKGFQFGLTQQYQLEPSRGATVTGIRDTKLGRINKSGKHVGSWVIRVDKPHSKAPTPHININEAISNTPDPHTSISPNMLKALGNGGKVLNTVGKVAKPIGIATDATRITTAYIEDGGKIGNATITTSSSVAGGWAGAWGGAVLVGKGGVAIGGIIGGPVGAAIGGFAGSVVGGIAGAFGGSWLGEKAAGEVLNSNKK